jgi:hypothetical protein
MIVSCGWCAETLLTTMDRAAYDMADHALDLHRAVFLAEPEKLDVRFTVQGG